MKKTYLVTPMILLALGSTALAQDPVFATKKRPKPGAGEVVKTYKQKYLTCKELNGPVMHACLAYGVLGMRLCYAEGKNGAFYVAKNDFLPQFNAYNGNDCMERFRIIRYMCKNGIESGRFDTMKCIQRP